MRGNTKNCSDVPQCSCDMQVNHFITNLIINNMASSIRRLLGKLAILTFGGFVLGFNLYCRSDNGEKRLLIGMTPSEVSSVLGREIDGSSERPHEEELPATVWCGDSGRMLVEFDSANKLTSFVFRTLGLNSAHIEAASRLLYGKPDSIITVDTPAQYVMFKWYFQLGEVRLVKSKYQPMIYGVAYSLRRDTTLPPIPVETR